MGFERNITHSSFPRQGTGLGREVLVCFHYDSDNLVPGQIVRDDDEEPWRTVIMLADDRFVLATECQYTFAPAARAKEEEQPKEVLNQHEGGVT